MVTALAHVCITAPDLAAAERFYCDGLGCRKAFEFRRPSGERVGFYLRVHGQTFIEVFQQGDILPEERHPLKHLCFEVADVDTAAKRLRTLGYEVGEKKLGCDGSWQAWTADPGGVRIEFHQYTPQSCQITGDTCTVTW
jgi:catechol 2,3-dioxygenase-like lactoylglutathione lyase family enzyme